MYVKTFFLIYEYFLFRRSWDERRCNLKGINQETYPKYIYVIFNQYNTEMPHDIPEIT